MLIRNFLHKGLERYALTGNASGINPSHTMKIRLLLDALSLADNLREITEPSLHALGRHRAKLKDWYSVSVNGNWRITFFYDGKEKTVRDVNYIDYH